MGSSLFAAFDQLSTLTTLAGFLWKVAKRKTRLLSMSSHVAVA